MFKSPPRMMPVLACRDMPMLRMRLDSTLESTVGTPPNTMTHMAYCRAYSYVLSPAPSRESSGRMNRPMPTENSAETASPRYSEKALTRRASSASPCPSRREISEPPPMPASPARHRVMLNTGRISEVAATMYGSLVWPT